MIETLRLRTTRVSDTQWRVDWYGATRSYGILHVTGAQIFEKSDAAAEIAAIHYLIVESAIYGPERCGVNIAIHLSVGAARKVLKDAGDPALRSATTWLRARLDEAQVVVERDASWIKEGSLQRVESIEVQQVFDDYATLPRFGKVVISHHLLERAQGRSGCATPRQTFNLIRRSLDRINKIVLFPDQILAGQFERHGVQALSLYDEVDGWIFVLTPPRKQSLPTIATMYHPNYSLKPKNWRLVSDADVASFGVASAA
jgi:hypothetical protein